MKDGSFVVIGAKDSNYGPILDFNLFRETDVITNFFQSFRGVMVKGDNGDCSTYFVGEDATLCCGDIFRIKAILRTEVEGSSMFYLVADKFEDFEREDEYIR